MITKTLDRPRLTTLQIAMVAIFCAALCAVPAVSSAAKPPTNNNSQLSIAANPKQVTATRAVAITGRLKGSSVAGQVMSLQANPFPFAGFVAVATASTDSLGNYKFSATPMLNTRYRVQTTSLAPAQTSGEITVTVAPRISLSLSDRTPRRGQLVRFRGFVWPAHDGRTAQLQRRTATGSWRTVGRLTLTDDGELRSKYSRRMRIRSSGAYRVQLLADADHATGFSAIRSARVN